MAPNKEAVMIVLDVGPNMTQKCPGSKSFLELSVECIIMILQRKMFAESKDEIGVVLFGTVDTDNQLAQSNQYQNIVECQGLKQADWDTISCIQDLIPGTTSADFIDALVVGLNFLVEESRGKKFDGQKLLLFSNFDHEYSDDQLDVIINGMKSTEIDLSVIGPNLDEPNDYSTTEQRSKQKSEQQRKGEKLISQVLKGVDGQCFSFDEAVPILSFFQRKAIRSTPWNVNLEIGNNLQIPVSSYIKIREFKAKSWKECYADDENTALIKETSYHLNNEAQTDVSKEDTIEAYRYGSTLVPFTEEDKFHMTYQNSEKCLSVLGFTKQENVRRHFYSGAGVNLITGRKDDEVAAVALSAFIHALYETNMVAIVRYCYSRNSSPKIGVLLPHIKKKYECLIYIQLPFSEDLRQYTFLPLEYNKQNVPSDDDMEVVDELITAMELAEEKDNTGSQELLKPKSILNPEIQRLYQCLTSRALHPEMSLPEIEDAVLQYLQPPYEASSVIDKLSKTFTLEEVIKKVQEKTGASLFKISSEKENNEKGTSPMEIISNAEKVISQIGTVTPVDDFEKLICQSENNPAQVCKDMQDVIWKLLRESFGNQLFEKAFACLVSLRKEAMKTAVTQFNQFLQSLKTSLFEKGQKEFWQYVIEAKLSLITDKESQLSSVSEDEANQFLKISLKEPNDIPIDEDIDDLVDLM